MDKKLSNKLDQVLQECFQVYPSPGMAIGIIENGIPVYMKGFGVLNVLSGAPVTADSLFHMASVTKTFVSTLIMQLTERGKLSLDHPLIGSLPYFKLGDERYKKINPRQLLSHTSGMPDCGDDYGWEHPEFDEGALERYVRSLSGLKMLHNPGEKYAYSNIGYEVLGSLIAATTGLSFERTIQNNLFIPLRMRNSTLSYREAPGNLLASPHLHDENGGFQISLIYPYHRAHSASSTLVSNLKDMLRYAAAHLNKGELDLKIILKKATYELMWAPVMNTGEGLEQKVALGWFVDKLHGVRMVGHTGSDVGFNSTFQLLPERKLGVVVMVNCMNRLARIAGRLALEIMLDKEPKPWKPDSNLLEQVTGKYRTETGKEIHLHYEDGILGCEYPRGVCRMVPGDVEKYIGTSKNEYFEFYPKGYQETGYPVIHWNDEIYRLERT